MNYRRMANFTNILVLSAIFLTVSENFEFTRTCQETGEQISDLFFRYRLINHPKNLAIYFLDRLNKFDPILNGLFSMVKNLLHYQY